jgi:hypothetical protein
MKTDITPNIGTSPDNTDDTRGGLGRDGLRELVKFLNDGGLLIAEGSPARTLVAPLTQGIGIEQPQGLYAPGSVMKALLGDMTSPILYGFDQKAMGVLYNVGPIFTVGGNAAAAVAGGGGGGGGRGGALPAGVGGGNLQPMAAPVRLTTLDGTAYVPPPGVVPAGGGGGRGGGGGPAGGGAPPVAGAAGAPPAGAVAGGGGAAGAGGGRAGGGGGGRGGGAGGGGAAPAAGAPVQDLGVGQRGLPRVLLSYPTDVNDLLLSGELVGGENLAGHPILIDQQIGKGHVLLFGVRPFWRYETSGNYFLVFNAMLNWDNLGAGR